MALHWKDDDLRSFFGTVPRAENEDEDAHRWCSLQHTGERLKYELIIDGELQTVSISGDDEKPFGPDSLFEITVPCDSIIACKDRYYPDQTGLIFWYGDTSQRHNQTMHLLKRPDGDLKVWPITVWPHRHANFQSPIAYDPAKDG